VPIFSNQVIKHCVASFLTDFLMNNFSGFLKLPIPPVKLDTKNRQKSLDKKFDKKMILQNVLSPD